MATKPRIRELEELLAGLDGDNVDDTDDAFAFEGADGAGFGDVHDPSMGGTFTSVEPEPSDEPAGG